MNRADDRSVVERFARRYKHRVTEKDVFDNEWHSRSDNLQVTILDNANVIKLQSQCGLQERQQGALFLRQSTM